MHVYAFCSVSGYCQRGHLHNRLFFQRDVFLKVASLYLYVQCVTLSNITGVRDTLLSRCKLKSKILIKTDWNCYCSMRIVGSNVIQHLICCVNNCCLQLICERDLFVFECIFNGKRINSVVYIDCQLTEYIYENLR